MAVKYAVDGLHSGPTDRTISQSENSSAGPAKTLPIHSTYDVAVVGYGPVGIVFSTLLAQYGLKVIVVERYPERFQLSRAGHLDGETMRMFQRLGCMDQIELIARPSLAYSLVTSDLEVLQNLTQPPDGSGWRPSYLSASFQVEKVLSARALESGVEVYMGMTARRLEQDNDCAVLTVYPTGQEEAAAHTITASYVVGADGAGSFVQKAVGITRLDRGFPPVDMLVIDFEHNDPDRDIPKLQSNHQVMDVNRPTTAGRWGGERWSRWEVPRHAFETREMFEQEDFAWGILGKWDVKPTDGKIVRRAFYTFESTQAQGWRKGRVFLIGDAAHTMPPFMGQGMLSGFRDAVNLSWKLLAVLHGEAESALLETYYLERQPHVYAITEMSMMIGRTVLITDPEKGRQRDEALRSGKVPPPGRFPRLIGGIFRQPDHADASEADGRPGIQGRVTFDNRIDRLDQFVKPGWKLVTRLRIPPRLFGSRHKKLISALGIQIAHVSRGAFDAYVDVDGDYDIWYRTYNRKAFLTRPDNYVFGTARNLEQLPELLDDLANILTANDWTGMGAPLHDPSGYQKVSNAAETGGYRQAKTNGHAETSIQSLTEPNSNPSADMNGHLEGKDSDRFVAETKNCLTADTTGPLAHLTNGHPETETGLEPAAVAVSEV